MSNIETRRQSALEWIAESSSEDRIIHLDYSDGLYSTLLADAEGESESNGIVELWGDDWRIHLHRAT